MLYGNRKMSKAEIGRCSPEQVKLNTA